MEVAIFTFQKDVSSLSFVIHEKRFNYPMLLILSNKTREADFTIRVEKTPPSITLHDIYHATLMYDISQLVGVNISVVHSTVHIRVVFALSPADLSTRKIV